MKIGYACINLSIPCTSSSTFRIKSFSKEKFLEKTENNIDCLFKIIKWNVENNINFFRISSGIAPFADHPICKINWQKIFKKDFEEIGKFIRKHKMRISMHPDHFTILNSPKKDVVRKSIKTLEYHADIMDLLGLDSTNKMQIHLGGVYSDKEKSKKRFISNYKKLSKKVKNRLVLENDDRLFSLKDCLKISKETRIPILFDVFHHSILNNGESIKEATRLASKTWRKKDGYLMVDFSSQAKNKRKGAHADYVNKKDFENFIKETKGIKKDIILEAKKKDKAVLKLRK